MIFAQLMIKKDLKQGLIPS